MEPEKEMNVLEFLMEALEFLMGLFGAVILLCVILGLAIFTLELMAYLYIRAGGFYPFIVGVVFISLGGLLFILFIRAIINHYFY